MNSSEVGRQDPLRQGPHFPFFTFSFFHNPHQKIVLYRKSMHSEYGLMMNKITAHRFVLPIVTKFFQFLIPFFDDWFQMPDCTGNFCCNIRQEKGSETIEQNQYYEIYCASFFTYGLRNLGNILSVVPAFTTSTVKVMLSST